MIKSLIQKLIIPLRRILGIELILQNQRNHFKHLDDLFVQHFNSHRQAFAELKRLQQKASSLIEYSLVNEESVRQSPVYARFSEIVSLLSPMDVRDGNYSRFGRNYDGGYVMLNDHRLRKSKAAYSLGICNDVSWDQAIAELGIDVYMYDHTIESLPNEHPRFHFFRKGVTGREKGSDLETLSAIIAKNGHSECDNMIMKMDIEGCEWDVFDESSAETVGLFSQIVVEFHGLSPDMSDARYSQIRNALRKINQTHQSIHVHGNICESPVWIGGIVLPPIIEVTYVRRSDYEGRLVRNTRTFPTKIDQPTFAGLPDLELGCFRVDATQNSFN
jgi:hypothetical protein